MKRAALYIGFAVLMLTPWQGWAAAAPADYYIGQNSLAALEAARAQDPANYAVNYFLGRIYYKEGREAEAAEVWERYLLAAPDDGRSRAVREHVTVLKLELAREQARQVVARGGSADGQLPANTVAVTDFKNLGSEKLVPLIKGLTAMVITDLGKVPQVRVLERARIQALMQEMKLGLASGLVSKASAPRIGRMLGARNIAWGEMGQPANEDLKITSIVTEVVENTNLKQADVSGQVAKFFELQKQLVFGILEAMGIQPESLDPQVRQAVEQVHTTSVEALVQFGIGLDLFDAGNFTEAKEAFDKAVQIDPGFDLARKAEAATPADAAPVVPEDPGAEPVLATSAEQGGEEATEPSPDTTATTDDTTSTDTNLTTAVTDVNQQTTAAQTADDTLYDGSGMWFMANMLIAYSSTSSWVEDVFVGHSSSPGATSQTIPAVTPADTMNITTDPPTIVNVTVDGTTYPVNETGTYNRMGINQWIEWGTYDKLVDYTFTVGGTTYEFTQMWYLSGDNLETPALSGAYNYAGNAYGLYFDTAGAYDISGSFSCNIDFSGGTPAITGFFLNTTDGLHTASISNGSGSFAGNPSDPYLYNVGGPAGTFQLQGPGMSVPLNAVGVANGSVFSPTGEHTGGSWGMQAGSSVAASGIYVGDKQAAAMP